MKFASLNTLGAFLSKCDERYTASGEAAVYSIKKLDAAADGYLSSYQLLKNGAPSGDTINIPKDYLVKSGEVKTCQIIDTPVIGYEIGDKYIDFVVNTSDGTGNEKHIYLLVSDLVDTYTGGNGISVGSGNEISIKIGTANGLSVNGGGLNLAAATTTAAGAMSAADKTKLDKCVAASDFEEITADEINALFL